MKQTTSIWKAGLAMKFTLIASLGFLLLTGCNQKQVEPYRTVRAAVTTTGCSADGCQTGFLILTPGPTQGRPCTLYRLLGERGDTVTLQARYDESYGTLCDN